MLETGFLIAVLISGLALLWLAGDKVVRYAIELTDLLGISSFIVGFIVMSVSTGIPEILTAVMSSIGGVAALSAGNLLGASLINITLILGISILSAGTLPINPKDESSLLRILFIVMILISIILFTESLSVIHGIILIATYVMAIYVLQKTQLLTKIVKEEEKEAEEELITENILTGTYGTAFKFVGSLALVALGANITVESAVLLAGQFVASLETIGATIVALGTTLPELTLELNAVKRKEYALALGDLFGSTLVNLTLVLGLLSIISPVKVQILPLLGTIAYFLIIVAYIWYTMAQNHKFEKKHGIVLILLFIIFILEEIGIASLF